MVFQKINHIQHILISSKQADKKERERERERENRVTGCCCLSDWAGLLLSVEWFWWTLTPGCLHTFDVTSTLCGRHGTAMITDAQVNLSVSLSLSFFVSQTPNSFTPSKSSSAQSELSMDKSHDFMGKVSNAHRDTHTAII